MSNSLSISIEKVVYGGDGFGRLPADESGHGTAVFVPFVLEGEVVSATVVEQKKGFVRARADEIIRASAHRVQPECPYFGRCGGCHYQHADYSHQLEMKAAILRENLRRIAKLELDCELQMWSAQPWNYRNRARVKLQFAPAFALGFHRLNSNDLIAVERCPISSPLINRGIAALWEAGKSGKLPASIDEIELATGEGDVSLVLAGHFAAQTPRAMMRQWTEDFKNLMPEVAGVAAFLSERGKHGMATAPEAVVTTGAAELFYSVVGSKYRVSAGSFFQVNRYLAEKLVSLVTAGQKGTFALDLFAGVGLFSSALARTFAQVTAVETSPTSYADLLYNSPANVKAVRATTERYLADARKSTPDFVVVDPPRAGLGEKVVKALGKMRSLRVVYVSCDPATLARDLAGLLGLGYRIDQAHLIDLFPQTYHIESVFHLSA